VQGALVDGATKALARCSEAKLANHRVMSEYRPRATHGDPLRVAASPRAPIDGLRNHTSGSVWKPRISPLGDTTRTWNNRKLGLLTDLPASSTGAAILATEAIVITAHSHKGIAASSYKLA
jgi:hypothetical protein